MKKELDCIAIGSALLDTFVQLDESHHHPDLISPSSEDICFALGRKFDVPQIMHQSGGGATNAGTTFIRQLLQTKVISKIGLDTPGHIVLHELEHENLDTKYIVQSKMGKTGQSVILIDPDADRTIFTDRAAAETLNEHDISSLDQLYSRWVYLTSLHGSPKIVDHVFRWAMNSGTKIAWNPGIKDLDVSANLKKEWLKAVSLLILNKEEAEMLLNTTGSVSELASGLHKHDVGRAIVSNGAHPLAVLDNSHIWEMTPTKLNAVDQTGAGDALGSGTVAGLLLGHTFEKSVELGLLNSEHVVMHIGAKTGIMYRK